MKCLSVLLMLVVGFVGNAFAQADSQQTAPLETKGVCSPIAPDNKGTITITCSGFSDKQNKQIVDFLKQLSSEQARDQDILLQKLDEIITALKTAQREANPRRISDEAQTRILRSAWGICRLTPILVIAPSGDDEAGSLAVQLANLFGRAGRSARVEYMRVGQTTAKADVIIASDNFDPCPYHYMTASGASLNFSVVATRENGPGCDGHSLELPKGEKVDLVYVCRK